MKTGLSRFKGLKAKHVPESRFRSLPDKITVFKRRSALSNDPLWVHPRYVFIVALEGEGSVIVDGHFKHLSPGKCFLIFPFQSHHFSQFKKDQIDWLFFTFNWAEHTSIEAFRHQIMLMDHKALACLEHVLENAQNPAGGCTALSLHFALLFDRLLRQVQEKGGKSKEQKKRLLSATQRSWQELVQTICAYVQNNLDKAITPAELCRLLPYSSTHIRRVFKSATNCGLSAFIRRQKCNKANYLLQHSAHTVSEIAEQCGFDSIYSFSRAFKKETAQAPSMVRKKPS